MPASVGIGLAAVSGAQWAPSRLGDSLLALWDAERADLLSLSGASVVTWTDSIGGYAPTQPTSGSQPAYSATGFNGRPGITFDGTDDCLELGSVPASITGTNTCEIWALCNQTALAADATTRTLIAYGDGGVVGQSRRLTRSVASGVNRISATVGNGTSPQAGTGTTVDFSDVHVVRLRMEAAQSVMFVEAVNDGAFAVVPSSASARFRIGARDNATASVFWKGAVNCIALTTLLADGEANLLNAYLKVRGGIA